MTSLLRYWKMIVGLVGALALLGIGGWAGAKLASMSAAYTINKQARRIAALEGAKSSWDKVTDKLLLEAKLAKQMAKEQVVKAKQADVALQATVHKANAMRDSYDKRLAEAKARAEKQAMTKCDISQAVVPPKLMGY